MKFAYADPPYLGQGRKLYAEHHEDAADWDDPETHRQLVQRLQDEFPDGWALSLSTPSLRILAPMMPEDIRWASWSKPFAVFKPNVNPAYTWEPVAFRGGRKRDRTKDTVKDHHIEVITLRRGMPGAKPPGFAAWIPQLLGADVRQGDTITDLFHGSGAMLGVWRAVVDSKAVEDSYEEGRRVGWQEAHEEMGPQTDDVSVCEVCEGRGRHRDSFERCAPCRGTGFYPSPA